MKHIYCSGFEHPLPHYLKHISHAELKHVKLALGKNTGELVKLKVTYPRHLYQEHRKEEDAQTQGKENCGKGEGKEKSESKSLGSSRRCLQV